MNWVYERWINGAEPASWNGLRPVVLFNAQPYPWEVPTCTALVKEGPKALVKVSQP